MNATFKGKILTKRYDCTGGYRDKLLREPKLYTFHDTKWSAFHHSEMNENFLPMGRDCIVIDDDTYFIESAIFDSDGGIVYFLEHVLEKNVEDEETEISKQKAEEKKEELMKQYLEYIKETEQKEQEAIKENDKEQVATEEVADESLFNKIKKWFKS